VTPKTDYLIRLRIGLEGGPVAAKVASSDRRIALASAIVNEATTFKKKDVAVVKPAAGDEMRELDMAFATGDRSEVRLVISNNGNDSSPPVSRISQVKLFTLGETFYQWTKAPRALLRGLQKNIFKTGVMFPLIAGGVLLLLLAGRGRGLTTLLAVPIYYLIVQSALSTEYRYILAIHYLLFVMAATTLYCVGLFTAQVFGHLWSKKFLEAHDERSAN
jgi:hypothetical protein